MLDVWSFGTGLVLGILITYAVYNRRERKQIQSNLDNPSSGNE